VSACAYRTDRHIRMLRARPGLREPDRQTLHEQRAAALRLGQGRRLDGGVRDGGAEGCVHVRQLGRRHREERAECCVGWARRSEGGSRDGAEVRTD